MQSAALRSPQKCGAPKNEEKVDFRSERREARTEEEGEAAKRCGALIIMSHAITLSRHVIEEEHKHHATTGTLSRLLLQVGFAAKLLAREIGRAALNGKLGLASDKNST